MALRLCLIILSIFFFLSCKTAQNPPTFQYNSDRSIVGIKTPCPPQSLVLVKVPEHPNWEIKDEFLSCFASEWQKIASSLPIYRKILLLNRLFEKSLNTLEQFWAAATLFLIYKRDGMNQQALEWLDKARSFEDSSALALEAAWIRCYETQEENHEQEQQLLSILSEENLQEKDHQKWRFVQVALRYSSLDLHKWGLDKNISSILIDHDDLWIATWKGALGRFSLITKKFKLLLKAPNGIAPIQHIRASRYFIYVFRDSIIQRYSKVTETWKNFPLPDHWSGLRIQDVVMTDETSFLAAHLGRGLWEWQAGQWTDHSSDMPSRFLNALFQEEDGSWLIGSQDRGLWKWRLKTKAEAWPKENQLNITFITRLKDHVIVGTYGNGLWSATDSELYQIAQEPFVVSSLKKGTHLWWGTLDLGLHRGWGASQKKWGISEGFPLRHITKIATWKNTLVLASPDQGIGIWIDED